VPMLPRRTAAGRDHRPLPRVLPRRPGRVGLAVALCGPRPDPAVGGGDVVNDQPPDRFVSGCMWTLSTIVLFLAIIGALTVASWVF
jgi:hypothetical protein